ncbi:Alpha/Beta hydrolase protein [Cryomyces antarcticus]
MAGSMAIKAAKIVEQKTQIVPGKLKITEHFFDVPKDYSKPSAGTLRLFARSARKAENPADPEEEDEKKKQLPWLLYLQGGPGFECRSPQAYPWTNTMLDKGYQMLYLDQRGTGLSTPISASTLGLRGDNPVQANYLKLFRADSIVKDCEAIRKALTAGYPKAKQKWSIMGQSFGGFCSITYLSFFPEGLKEAFLCGGLQPLVKGPDEVYRRLYKKVIQRNESYYQKYPEDVERVKSIVKLLQRFGNSTVRLPSEGSLSARRFQQLGLMFGAHGGIDSLHEIVLRVSTELELFGHITRQTLASIDGAIGFDSNILYAMLHEPIYCQGTAPNWSAHRIREEFPQFDLDTDGPVFFTGEMIYPWMFDDYSELRKLKDQAELVAQTSDWPALFDEEQLAKNEVPVYAATYMEDMYVDFNFAQETAAKIKGCKTFVTNALYHDAVRSKVDEVMKQLFALRDDTID